MAIHSETFVSIRKFRVFITCEKGKKMFFLTLPPGKKGVKSQFDYLSSSVKKFSFFQKEDYFKFEASVCVDQKGFKNKSNDNLDLHM